jgi:hypothetical protein
MPKTEKFAQRVGKVFIPLAEELTIEPPQFFTPDPSDPFTQVPIDPQLPLLPPFEIDPIIPKFKFCFTRLKEGCYTVLFRPKGAHPIFGPLFRGTVRVENIRGGIRFSGDLYIRRFIIFPPVLTLDPVVRLRMNLSGDLDDGSSVDAPGVIPIFSRRSYHSYLKGTVASLISIKHGCCPCKFSLTFDEFRYQHPATGFDGTFPVAPNRTIRFALEHTATPDHYTGTVFEGATDLGTVTMSWVSPFFRRATLQIHRLQGADEPQAVPGSGGGNEDFRTVFNTAGWDLTVNSGGEVPLPAALVGVQDPNQCWSQANSATLMESVPGYNPSDLDTVWRAHLIAVPARLGCSRGRMFDSGSGNPNDIAREGALTHSHDGYPLADSPNFGVAEGGLQRDFPRAFIRSASHEVGHTFNQIHQELEGGSDNSIMTTTPSVADVLAAAGQTFPDDINLGFNARVRRHLVHLPDPAVRPGAMEFFGFAVTAPEADQVAWPPELALRLEVDEEIVNLGEPLSLKWTLTNEGDHSFLVPGRIEIHDLTARVSVTDADGKVTFLRPAEQQVCPVNPLIELAPGKSLTGSTTVFWGRDGFTFEKPGRHTVEVILLWQVSAANIGVTAETNIWVSYPVTEKENRVAAIMLDPDVGRAVAYGMVQPNSRAAQRIAEVMGVQETHPAYTKLKKIGLVKEDKKKKK